jgi:hypothetical protein
VNYIILYILFLIFGTHLHFSFDVPTVGSVPVMVSGGAMDDGGFWSNSHVVDALKRSG